MLIARLMSIEQKLPRAVALSPSWSPAGRNGPDSYPELPFAGEKEAASRTASSDIAHAVSRSESKKKTLDSYSDSPAASRASA